jgi:hypothetical protein
MSERVLLKPRRDELVDEAEEVVIAHVQQLRKIPLSFRWIED